MRSANACTQSISIQLLALAIGLSLMCADRLHSLGAAELEDQNARPHSAAPSARGDRAGVCEREAVQLVGQKPVRVGPSVTAPKKRRGAAPKYPDLPPGTVGSGMWLGEALINRSGTIARVWPLREVQFTPPFPAFNDAITDAIRQWEFEPLIVQGKAVPVCTTITVNINWR
jgi:outer membrane biosynthesis protein TonB